MNVTVRYHGIIGDMLRRKTQQVEMPDGATVSDLLAVVIGERRGRATILKQTRAFIDGKQADRATPTRRRRRSHLHAADRRGCRLRLSGGCHCVRWEGGRGVRRDRSSFSLTPPERTRRHPLSEAMPPTSTPSTPLAD